MKDLFKGKLIKVVAIIYFSVSVYGDLRGQEVIGLSTYLAIAVIIYITCTLLSYARK
jgi:hypothetical protein